jgi:hypothetical protein
MGRKMPLAIQAVLLRKSDTKLSDGPNVLDYPGSMSQWEKESRVAEARLSSGKKKETRTIRKRKNPTFLEAAPPTFVLSSIPRPI